MNIPDPSLWITCKHCGSLSSRAYSAHQCMVCGFEEE